MKTYNITFDGRLLGSIGKMHRCYLKIQAENWKDARLKMYDTHDHIYIISVNNTPYSYDKPNGGI